MPRYETLVSSTGRNPECGSALETTRVELGLPACLLYLSIIRQFFGNLVPSSTVETRWSLGGVFPSRAAFSTAARQEPRDNDKFF
jgi:hypothetical protein